MSSFRFRLVVVMALLLAGLRADAALYGVDMQNIQFIPSDLTINVGDTVMWSNRDATRHDTVSGAGGIPDGNWNSNDQYGRLMLPGESFSHAFNTPGTYSYYCTPHVEFGMSGSITVVQRSTGPTVAITSPSFGQSFPIGANVTVQVTATSSSGTVTKVEFLVNGNLYDTDTTAPFSTTLTSLNAGEYSIEARATDSFGTSSSDGVDITVSAQLPAITVRPQSQIVTPSNNVVFSVTAVGTPPLRYQWSFNNNPISGATATSLSLPNVQTGNSGTYKIRVDNSYGFATAAATLIVTNIPPGTPARITSQPQSQIVPATSNVSLTVGALGSGLLRYQWYFNGGKVSAGTTSTLALKNVTTNQSGNYFAIVSNAFGRATSAVAKLTVVSPSSCDYAISPASASFGSTGGTGQIVLTTGTACSWQILNTNSWITIVNGSIGAGSHTISFNVANNLGHMRVGYVVIAGKLFTIQQKGLLPSSNDFDRNGSSDFLWQNSDGRLLVWLMNGGALSRYYALRSQPADTNWQVAATADMNRDKNPDVVWQHSNGTVAVWLMNGNTVTTNIVIAGPQLGPLWRLANVADLNGDGKPDFIFHHRDGYLVAWTMNGTTFVSQAFLFDGEPVPSEWSIVGAADFSGDEKPDIVWQRADGTIVIWKMTGSRPTVATQINGPAIPSGAHITGVADLNLDSKTDFIWRQANGVLFGWLMNGTNFIRSTTVAGGGVVSLDWNLVAPKN